MAVRAGEIIIDGKLDESAWQSAEPLTKFTQQVPDEGKPATQRTEVRILYDQDALYVGARMYDSLGRAGVRAPLARRDQLVNSQTLTTDKIAVVLDPYHNHRDRIWFEVNPAGVKGEQFSGDVSFDPIWEAAATIDADGWSAEMRIPLSQLHFSRDSLQTWGLQIWRAVDRLHEQDMWSFWKLNEAGGPPFFGHLVGMRLGARPRQVELVPYVVGRSQFKFAQPGDPFHASSERDVRVGGDAKILLTSNLTLDATVNPDFGQVEVDPATVNLSAFETFFQEKRPFFVAGRNAFNYGGFNCFFCDNVSSLDLFYSRRIGRRPQLNDWVSNNSSFNDLPETAQILGAGKVTGRAGEYTVGLLDAVTNRETARFSGDALPGMPTLSQEVEPLTNYFVGRARRDFRNGATSLGGMVTSTARRLDDSLLVSTLRSRATAVGLDMDHSWHKQDYSVLAQFAVSDVGGSTDVMTSTQQSSAHYFNRPDRKVTSDGLFDARYDPNRTDLRGYGLYARLGKDNGNWLWETAQNWRSPGFEVNDLSYLDRADYKWMLANVARQWTKPFGPFRYVNLTAGAQDQYNYDGDRTDTEQHYGGFLNLKNYWSTNIFYIHHPSTLDDHLARGGPMLVRTGYDYGSFNVSTDSRRLTVFSVRADVAHGISSPTHTLQLRPSVSIKPASSVFISFAPSLNADEDASQYVLTVKDPTATLFSGNRYVFSYIRTRVLSLDTRLNVTFTPDLTLELFAQPFFASGQYSHFREFAAPRTSRRLDYGRDIGTITYDAPGATYTVDPDGPAGPAVPFNFSNPDFTVRSLRGNAVLRYEYRPGSTVFLVWTQERNGYDPTGRFVFRDQTRSLLSDRPVNIFLLKVNYWVGR
ncbi:MAG: DUF5916 domain-containing protein [Gemmatimonadaceae bacterium]